MEILVINAGSTSIKFKLFDDGFNELISGMIDQRQDETVFKLVKQGKKYEWQIDPKDFAREAELILKELGNHKPDKIGFRVVHGGEKYIKPTQIDDAVMAELESLVRLAPLHNPPAIKAITDFKNLFPEVPMYAVFDTAFHSTLPDFAYHYALPHEYHKKYQIRRYGFHGTSHKYVTARLAKLEPAAHKIISCHLGGGASVCAIMDGSSLDTSMGFTPLEGLIMATRAGDLDAGVVLFLEQKLNMDDAQMNDLLNKQSGLLGISGSTSDMRTLLELEAKGNKNATLAIKMYVYRIRKYIGSYAAVLGGCDALVFTAGVGQGSDVLRKRVVEGLQYLNLEVSAELNDGRVNVSEELQISPAGSKSVWVIPANEELQIAREIA
jgi:acetate kinase